MRNNTPLLIIIGAILILIILLIVLSFMPQDNSNSSSNNSSSSTPTTEISNANVSQERREYNVEVIEEGTGETTQPGDTIEVHYTGTLLDGTKFDSSLDRGEPFKFLLGQGQVIRGWDEGMANQKVGSKIKLTLPPEYAYGENGAGSLIPGGATLLFDVEILGIE